MELIIVILSYLGIPALTYLLVKKLKSNLDYISWEKCILLSFLQAIGFSYSISVGLHMALPIPTLFIFINYIYHDQQITAYQFIMPAIVFLISILYYTHTKKQLKKKEKT